MQKSHLPVTSNVVLVKGNQIFLENSEIIKKKHKWLFNLWIHIFMEIYPLSKIWSYQIINRVGYKASVDCI